MIGHYTTRASDINTLPGTSLKAFQMNHRMRVRTEGPRIDRPQSSKISVQPPQTTQTPAHSLRATEDELSEFKGGNSAAQEREKRASPKPGEVTESHRERSDRPDEFPEGGEEWF